MKKNLFYLTLLFLSTISAYNLFASYPKKMIICVPVADLRKEPTKNAAAPKYPLLSKDNPLQDSQLLMGEFVYAFQKKIHFSSGEKWLKVYALEQTTYKDGSPAYKEGWIEKKQAIEVNDFPIHNIVIKERWANCLESYKSEISVSDPADFKPKIIEFLSIGTKLLGQKINIQWFRVFLPNGQVGYIEAKNIFYIKPPENLESESFLRAQIYDNALKFYTTPYSWGGKSGYSLHLSPQVTGVDCSGFINLSYRTLGLEVPRDAHDQFLASQRIYFGKDLKVGDLIFFASKDNPKKIIHVAMYVFEKDHGAMFMESVGSEWPFENRMYPDTYRIGAKFENMENGKTYGNYVLYFGSFLNNQNLVAGLRANALKNKFTEFKNLETTATFTNHSLDYKKTAA